MQQYRVTDMIVCHSDAYQLIDDLIKSSRLDIVSCNRYPLFYVGSALVRDRTKYGTFPLLKLDELGPRDFCGCLWLDMDSERGVRLCFPSF